MSRASSILSFASLNVIRATPSATGE